MEVNFANLVDDLVVVESDEAKAAVPIGNFVVGQHCIFDHAAIKMSSECTKVQGDAGGLAVD